MSRLLDRGSNLSMTSHYQKLMFDEHEAGKLVNDITGLLSAILSHITSASMCLISLG